LSISLLHPLQGLRNHLILEEEEEEEEEEKAGRQCNSLMNGCQK